MRLFIVIALLLSAPVSAQANASRATQMCRWLDSMEFVVGKCAVSGKAVDIKVEAPNTEAQGVCDTIAKTLRGDGVRFDAGWKLRIFNPKTDNAKTAECKL